MGFLKDTIVTSTLFLKNGIKILRFRPNSLALCIVNLLAYLGSIGRACLPYTKVSPPKYV